MTPDDLERLRHPSPLWRPDMRCADCWGSPTCPQLHDALWLMVWEAQEPRAPRVCNCADWERLGARSPRGPRVSVGADMHWRACDVVRAPFRRQLLCLECAEGRLGRRLTLLDLKPCVGNYHAFAAVQRAVEDAAARVARGESVREIVYGPQIDQLIRKSSVGQGLARIAAGDLSGELRQYEACPLGGDRGGRHLWNPLTVSEVLAQTDAEMAAQVTEKCLCGATR